MSLPARLRRQDVTIVIVNWNGGQLLARCLASLRAHAAGVSVLVVDNASTDGSRDMVALDFPEVGLVDSGGNIGFGRANNLARAHVVTPLVLFLNPDTEMGPDTIDTVVRCLDAHPEVGALGCRMVEPDGRVQPLGLQWNATPWTTLAELLFVSRLTLPYVQAWLPVADPLRSGHVSKLYGGFVLARREVLDAAGWFDERYFMYAEDADLSRTITALGWRLYYCSETSIMHVGGGVTTEAPNTFSLLMMQESVNKMIGKYEGANAARLHRLVVALGGTCRLAIALPRRLWAAFAGRAHDKRAASESWRKQRALVLWAAGLRSARIPTARADASSADLPGTAE